MCFEGYLPTTSNASDNTDSFSSTIVILAMLLKRSISINWFLNPIALTTKIYFFALSDEKLKSPKSLEAVPRDVSCIVIFTLEIG